MTMNDNDVTGATELYGKKLLITTSGDRSYQIEMFSLISSS